jgi:hypothetical protein
VIDPRLGSRLYGRHEIIHENARAVNGLKTIPEGCDHHIDFFLCHQAASPFVDLPKSSGFRPRAGRWYKLTNYNYKHNLNFSQGSWRGYS